MKWRAVLGLSIGLLIATAQPALADVAGTWSPTGSMTAARSHFTAKLLPSGKVLVAGGIDCGSCSFVPVASAELYDPVTGTWSATGNMTAARADHTATLLPTGKVLVNGGDGGVIGGLASAELYDPAAGTWSPTGSMTEARIYNTATLLPRTGQVLVAGYGCCIVPVVTAELYDIATGTWSPTGSMTALRLRHTATLLPSGQVLVAGSEANGGVAVATAEIYSPEFGTWSATGSMTAPRILHTATLLPSGKVLVAGGIPGTGTLGTPVASAELYDPVFGTWSATGSMTAGRYVHTATLLSSGKVLVAGGAGGAGVILASAELYDPAAGTWSPTGSMTVPRILHTATVLTSGNVLVAGGEVIGAFPVASAELYTVRSLTGIVVTPASPVLEPGGTQQFAATGSYSDSTTADLTGLVTWSSSTAVVASISSGGLATALANGTSTITASLNGVSGTTLLTVHSLTAIVVTPANPGSAPGGTLYFTATGTYSDSSTADLTGLVTWSSGTPALASISSGGLATALANGTSTITASLGPVSGTTLFTVRSLTGIVVTPVNPVLALGSSLQFKATGTYSDGTTTDLTCGWGVIWSSSTPAVASIDCGLATALANGTSSITASWFKPGPASGTTLLTVGDTDLGLTGVPANVTVNLTGPLGAVVTYAAPTAIDEAGDSPAPTVSCTPGSGSTFVTGTTTVTCTATSADDSPSTVSGTFTVTVVASPVGISNVVGQLLAAGSINNSGIASALSAKLTAAQNAIAAGNLKTAINILSAFIDQAQAQNGKHILAASTLNGVTFSPSAVLIADARSLIDSLTATTVPNPITGTVVTSTGAAAPGATVSLVDSNGAIVATATSDVTGFYFFATTGLLSAGATYSVSVTGFPAGFTSSAPAVQTFTWTGSSISFSNFTLT
jgi:Bacterial Ig-like domain (group 2)/Galactose oxidase, central domain/HYR domain